MDRESLAAQAAATAAELRVQLAQLTAASQLLERVATGPKERGYLAMVNQGIYRMLRTVSRMELAHRLTDENEIRAFPQITDLGRWAEELCPRIESILALTGVEFRWQAADSLLANVDPALTQHMLLELISNAAKAGKQVRFTLAQREDKVCFTVSDDGEGLTPEVLTRLVDPEQSGAEGQGVALVQRIAQLHGGHLMADTAPGRGVTMMVTLPQRLELPGGRLQSPAAYAPQGGFDPVQVALSGLLPVEAFAPDELD